MDTVTFTKDRDETVFQSRNIPNNQGGACQSNRISCFTAICCYVMLRWIVTLSVYTWLQSNAKVYTPLDNNREKAFG